MYWIFEQPIFPVAAILGFGLGVLYGLDGWRGSAVEVDLPKAPRVKFLIWGVTIGMAAVIGDIAKISPAAEKWFVILWYLAGFFGGIILIVGGFASVIGSCHFHASRKGDNSYGVGEAIGDYIHRGYHNYRAELSKRQQAPSIQQFIPAYLGQLTYALAAAASHIDRDGRLRTARQILQTISTVVKLFRDERHDDLKIKTNLMIVRDCTDHLRQKLKFIEENHRPNIKTCLELVAYDTDRDDFKLVLPLPQNDDQSLSLPGAPLAYLTDSVVIVDDTKKMPFQPNVSKVVRKQSSEYFSQKRFRSFASMKIVAKGQTIAIVNVESIKPSIFGHEESKKQQLAEFLLPFCSALGILSADGL